MKTELTVEDLAPYLPYSLKIQGATLGQIEELEQLSSTNVNIKGRSNIYGAWADISDIKPILRPLSDWRIVEDGTRFLSPYFHQLSNMDGGIKGNILSAPYDDIQLLLVKHFDVYSLIDKGLAVSYNDLK